MEGGTCASMAHSPAYNKCVSGPCEQCSKADARHADAVVSSVIMMSRHTTLSLLDVVVCRIVCQKQKEDGQKLCGPNPEVAAARGHLGF